MKKLHNIIAPFSLRFLVMIAALIALSGCYEETPIPTPTKQPCPTTIASTPIRKGNSPKLIVVLVKEIPGYKEYAFQAFKVLLRTLPEFMEPGDRLVVLSMEQFDLESALILDEEVAFV